MRFIKSPLFMLSIKMTGINFHPLSSTNCEVREDASNIEICSLIE